MILLWRRLSAQSTIPWAATLLSQSLLTAISRASPLPVDNVVWPWPWFWFVSIFTCFLISVGALALSCVLSGDSTFLVSHSAFSIFILLLMWLVAKHLLGDADALVPVLLLLQSDLLLSGSLDHSSPLSLIYCLFWLLIGKFDRRRPQRRLGERVTPLWHRRMQALPIILFLNNL